MKLRILQQTICTLGVLLFLTAKSIGQSSSKREIYNKDFNWTVTIPENFERVSDKDWAKIQNRGEAVMEETLEGDIINKSKIIFVFKSDQFNYFESNYQPFDPTDNYLESCKQVNNMLYETFIAQMPDTRIDTITSVAKIDNLDFQVFKIKIEYPNKMIFNMIMYSRLFDKREFTVNIMYVDESKGAQMIEAWEKSKFSK